MLGSSIKYLDGRGHQQFFTEGTEMLDVKQDAEFDLDSIIPTRD